MSWSMACKIMWFCKLVVSRNHIAIFYSKRQNPFTCCRALEKKLGLGSDSIDVPARQNISVVAQPSETNCSEQDWYEWFGQAEPVTLTFLSPVALMDECHICHKLSYLRSCVMASSMSCKESPPLIDG